MLPLNWYFLEAIEQNAKIYRMHRVGVAVRCVNGDFIAPIGSPEVFYVSTSLQQKIFRILLCFVCLAAASRGNSTEPASLSMRFILDGEPPPAMKVDATPDFESVDIFDERLLVDSESKGIRNVVVFVYPRQKPFNLKLEPYKGVTRQIEMNEGRFTPRVTIARAGDTIEFVPKGSIGYNPRMLRVNNLSSGFLQPTNGPIRIHVPKPEPAVLPVTCNLHPWMRAHVLVLDHRFASSTGSDGRMTITGLPSETTLVFRAFHEAIEFENMKIDGKKTRWEHGKFRVKLKAGENSLGNILIPLESVGK